MAVFGTVAKNAIGNRNPTLTSGRTSFARIWIETVELIANFARKAGK
jgi:hypothetical protein